MEGYFAGLVIAAAIYIAGWTIADAIKGLPGWRDPDEETKKMGNSKK